MKKLTAIFIVLMLGIVIVGAVVLKIKSGQRYYPLKLFSSEALGLKRGSICDVNGEILVVSQPAYTLLVEPIRGIVYHNLLEPLGLPEFFSASLPACHGLWTPADLHILACNGCFCVAFGDR